jgi:UDP-N-acetylmuramate: L-alanyl-gamma-D-glutamyl-meso-diaminopimelate ligase
MDAADTAIIYFNPHAILLKNLPSITPEQVKEGFGNRALEVFTDSGLLQERLLSEEWNQKNLLMMSSGNFDGINIEELAKCIL